MRRKKTISGRKNAGRKNDRGIIITLVAVFMLFVIGAMAALSIDVVTLYTARSEAQLAADAAALAGARVLANSGMTSDTTNGLTPGAEILASTVALQVGQQNQVGGRNLIAANGEVVVVGFAGTATNPCTAPTNPCITVQVQRTDLPTFFARIWGRTQATVAASATAEAYNPSGATAPLPVAPSCVKPWLLPNIDPSPGGTTIFTRANGAITNPGLLGYTSTTAATRLSSVCPGVGTCAATTPVAWKYYPGDTTTTFQPPAAFPTCAPALITAYEESIAGCVETPIACNSGPSPGNPNPVNIDFFAYPNRNRETARAVNCLTHATTGGGDTVTTTNPPTPPSTAFEFVAGIDNPIPGTSGNDVMVSDSLVTVPVYDVGSGPPPAPTNPVQIIGFVQLFLNPDGLATPTFGPNRGQVNTTVINMVGCGIPAGGGATGQPILGNGASPVAVRLVSPP
jgi:hypothetical protein